MLVAMVMILSLVACGGGEADKEDADQEKTTSGETEAPVETTAPEDEPETEMPPEENEDDVENSDTIKSGSYTLPCGMKIQFFDSVRNDATGKWRRSATSDSFVPADYAYEYYNEMFSSDDEVHSIWNATLKTNTRLTVAFGILYVDTLEYVDGEEHDANIMFSGNVLDSKMIDIETGEQIEE